MQPTVELHNPTDQPLILGGAILATAVLRYSDGSPVESRQDQPFPMPAVLRRCRVDAGGFVAIGVGISLQPDEKASLPPGRYRQTDVRWGQLTAPDVDVLLMRG